MSYVYHFYKRFEINKWRQVLYHYLDKYIIAIKNKTQVVRKNPVVISLYLKIFLFF